METQLEDKSGIIDLGIGQPDLDILPVRGICGAAQHRFRDEDARFLQYGASQGSYRLRCDLAQFLSRQLDLSVAPDALLVTAGATDGLDAICARFTKPNDLVLVEEPTYLFALEVLRDRHLRIESVPMDRDGLDVNALEQRLADEKPALLYTIPTHHNPSTATLTVERRKRLAELSREHGVLVVADEVYQLLSFYEPAPPSLVSYGGRILSLGSFSKILAPGLRLGWVHGDPATVSQLASSGVRHSGGGTSPFTCGVVRSAFELGIVEETASALSNIYRARAECLAGSLEALLPMEINFRRPRGGFFIWLELPEDLDAAKLLARAHATGVGYRPGTLFSARSELRNFVRVSFAHYGEEQLEDAARRLARTFELL